MINVEQYSQVSERNQERLRDAAQERLARASQATPTVNHSMTTRLGIVAGRVRAAIARRLVGLAGVS
ncbi:MAG TPA: hypothetical protein VGJ71_05695 [Candidatus Limnocylindrales bacterium]|jgi:hypothetical protein